MGNESSCAAVHQRIAYKGGSVHMEPVPVVPWAQADTSQTAGFAVATGGATSSDVADADDDDGGVVAAKASSTSYVSVSLSSLLLMFSSCSVGRLSAMCLRQRCWMTSALPSSLPVVSGGHVSTCYSLLQSLFFLLHWDWEYRWLLHAYLNPRDLLRRTYSI